MTGILGVGLVILVGLGVWSRLVRKPVTPENSDGLAVPTSPDEALPIQVEAAPARIGELVIRLSVTGITKALQEITVSPKVGGEIVQLPIEEGQFVHKGALLMKLDDREYRLALAETRDRLLGAQVEYGMLLQDERGSKSEKRGAKSGERERNSEKGIVNRKSGITDPQSGFLDSLRQKFIRGELTEKAYLQAKLDYETGQVLAGKRRDELMRHQSGLTAAAVALQRAELNLSYTEIRAPFSGHVADVQVEEGQQVAAGNECFKLVDLSQIEVELQVLESEIGLAQEGRKAEVTFPAYPGETFRGRVVSINPMIDEESKTAKVTVRLDNPERRILPGMFAYAKLEAQIFKDRFLVPKEALLIRDQRKLVFVVRDGLAKWCYVETGLENEGFVEILDSTFGLKPGEMVITSGHYTLVHDAKVRF